jgi:hypothetical protein
LGCLQCSVSRVGRRPRRSEPLRCVRHLRYLTTPVQRLRRWLIGATRLGTPPSETAVGARFSVEAARVGGIVRLCGLTRTSVSRRDTALSDQHADGHATWGWQGWRHRSIACLGGGEPPVSPACGGNASACRDPDGATRSVHACLLVQSVPRSARRDLAESVDLGRTRIRDARGEGVGSPTRKLGGAGFHGLTRPELLRLPRIFQSGIRR